jgi:hypothetical protein
MKTDRHLELVGWSGAGYFLEAIGNDTLRPNRRGAMSANFDIICALSSFQYQSFNSTLHLFDRELAEVLALGSLLWPQELSSNIHHF